MMKIKLSLILIFLSSAIFAQNGSTSPYSGGGLGEKNFNGTEANRHMGGLDVFTDSIHANLNNPASFGLLKLTTYSVGVNYSSNRLSSKTDTYSADTASLDYLAVSIPAGIFGFSFGIMPYSSLGYKVESLSGLEGSETLNRYESSGGVNQTYLAVGIPITKFFVVGATANYNFGTLFYRTGQFLNGVDNGTFLSNQSSISGLSYLFSAQANFSIKNKYELQGMFSFQPKAPLNSQNNRAFFAQSLSNQSIADFVEVDLNAQGLEETYLDVSETQRIGIGIGEKKKWFLGIQRNLTKSATFSNDFFKRDNIQYRDAKRWTLGGFYIPNYASFTSFWSKVVYRFGFRTEQMSLIVNNIPLTETGISFGVGLPLGGLSNANVGFEISQRGQEESDLIKETLIALRIGFSLSDRWFIKRKYN
jgi:hypothetical protein